MTAARLLAEARSQGVELYRVGDRLRWKASARIAPELAERLREQRTPLLALVPEGRPSDPPMSTRKAAHEEVNLASFGAMGAALAGDAITNDWLGLRVASRLLGEDVWLVPDDASADALERELEAEGKSLLVFTLAEVLAMQAMVAADMRTIAKVKRTLAGADLGGRIESVTRRERSA